MRGSELYILFGTIEILNLLSGTWVVEPMCFGEDHVTFIIEHLQKFLSIRLFHLVVGKQTFDCCIATALLHTLVWAMLKPR